VPFHDTVIEPEVYLAVIPVGASMASVISIYSTFSMLKEWVTWPPWNIWSTLWVSAATPKASMVIARAQIIFFIAIVF
jgi:hypothetical protein